MKIKTYNYLPLEAKFIRQTVFVDEQGFETEFDELDKKATHIVIFHGVKAVATSRFYYDKNKQTFIAGRIAVVKSCRNLHLGAQLLAATEQAVREQGGRQLALAAQVRVRDFYTKQGYITFGTVFDDEGCPHIWMQKKL